MGIRAAIIEDESKAAEGLVAQLARVAPQVEVVGIAAAVAEALPMLAEKQPDLVFLDIELRDGTGFDLLRQFAEPPFGVVFTTAYDGYAIQAFRLSAVDYLLKPVFSEDLRAAVARFESRERAVDRASVQAWMKNNEVGGMERKLAVHEVQGIRFLRLGDVLRLEAESNYSKVVLAGGDSVLSTRGLKGYSELLEPMGFFRCHKSHLVNLRHVMRYVRGRKPQLEMQDGARVAVARQVREELLKALESLSL